MEYLRIQGAHEGNLRNLSLDIPKGSLAVFTGLSGSGKTTLAVDVIYQECQRQYLEAIGYQGIHKPGVEAMEGASPAILIGQRGYQGNPRSTVGTVTNIYTELRMLYEKLGERECPYCHSRIRACDCEEETEKREGDFFVYQYCSECGRRMDKATRTWFSFNTREGACPTCKGLGKTLAVREEEVLRRELSLEEGAVDFWAYRYKDFQTEAMYRAFAHYGIPVEPGTPVEKFSRAQRDILLYGVEDERVKRAFPHICPPETMEKGRVEGIYCRLFRKLSEKGEEGGLGKYFREETCSDCGGERLGEIGRSVTVGGRRLPELSVLSLEELLDWIEGVGEELGEGERTLTSSYLLDLKTKLRRLSRAGLGYLSLDRQTMTLSGGEAQRIRLAAAMDSRLTGVIYILDEPTVGLHPRDTSGVIRILKELRGLGNTVIVIEHDTEVMREADYIVDIGPGAGRAGGEVVGTGTLSELMEQPSSVTGAWLRQKREAEVQGKESLPDGEWVKVRGAGLHNLRKLSADFPVGRMTCVTGVSGSGKSTLVFGVLAGAAGESEAGRKGEDCGSSRGCVTGLDRFNRVVVVDQSAPVRMKRSNVATYSGLYTQIRRIFGGLPEAREKGLNAGHFSFNSGGGRCGNCQGLGVVVSNMLFFEDLEVTCPVCGGKQFSDVVLSVKYRGLSIRDVLHTSVEEAARVFTGHAGLCRGLELLVETGLGYLELGQTLTTLSSGEAQRLRLAREIGESGRGRTLYLIDEPTVGLHPVDVENFLKLLRRLVETGATVVVVEHNTQVMEAADWIVDLGPGGGVHGGRLVAQGTPEEIRSNPDSVTGRWMKNAGVSGLEEGVCRP